MDADAAMGAGFSGAGPGFRLRREVSKIVLFQIEDEITENVFGGTEPAREQATESCTRASRRYERGAISSISKEDRACCGAAGDWWLADRSGLRLMLGDPGWKPEEPAPRKAVAG